MYLRVSVTDHCNLRCTYCLPDHASFARARATADELDALMGAICRTVPITKIRLTGGEPTVCPTLLQHVRAAARVVPTVGMTTNGVLLEPLLPALMNAGLNRLNISLDAADTEQFQRVTRRDSFAKVVAGVRAARRAGFVPLKVNAVATPDTDPAALVRFAIEEGLHLRFIELMDIGEAHADWAERHVTAETIRTRIEAAGLTLIEAPDRDEPTSRVWTVAGVAPRETTVGFITTVSAPFCSSCDRIRLSAQGRLHTCLFEEGGADLLTPLRAGDHDGLRGVIEHAVATKAPASSFQRAGVMAGIGG